VVHDGRVRYRDRRDAGVRLGAAVAAAGLHRPTVLALPRGGVPVAVEVGRALHAPVEVFVCRKIGAPGHAELGIGAVAEGDEPRLDRRSLEQLRVSPRAVAGIAAAEVEEVRRRVAAYRGGRDLPPLDGDVVVVDDGLATGVTAEAALLALRPRVGGRLVLAVPVGAPDAVARLGGIADEVVCPEQPPDLGAVGWWYDDFAQVEDRQVLDLLAAHCAARLPEGPGPGNRPTP
jgi:predicted phosphoribosyltransferase